MILDPKPVKGKNNICCGSTVRFFFLQNSQTCTKNIPYWQCCDIFQFFRICKNLSKTIYYFKFCMYFYTEYLYMNFYVINQISINTHTFSQNRVSFLVLSFPDTQFPHMFYFFIITYWYYELLKCGIDEPKLATQ